VLSLVLALSLCAADDEVASTIDRELGEGRWLDAARTWTRAENRDAIVLDLNWYARARLMLALSIEQPELAAKLDPGPDAGVVVDEHYSFYEEWNHLEQVLAARHGDARTRWDLAVALRSQRMHFFPVLGFQGCACIATAIGGTAGQLVATGCTRFTPPTPGDERASRALAALMPQAEIGRGMVPFPIGTTPFVRSKLEWKGPPAKALNRKSVEVPLGFEVMRAEQSGTRLVVLAWSGTLDPSGELPGGGYWLLIREGNTSKWNELYLGIRAFRPTEIKAKSKVPMLGADGVVRLEAVDHGAFGPQPNPAALLVTSNPFLLVAPLSEFTRDTDFDGLTDVLESRMRLDPTLSDSDWDGVGDAEDPAPRSHARAQTWPLLVQIAFERSYSTRFLISRKRVERPTVMLGIDRAPPSSAAIRYVALTRAEVEASAFTDPDWFGPRVTVVIDDSGDHAFVEFDEQMSGWSWRVDRAADGTITLTEVGGWAI